MNQSPLTINHSPIVIVGAGISGLCCAYFLKKQGVNVLVLEQDSEVGGTMKTIHEDGWLIETGPNSALETTPLFEQLFKELGIMDEVVYGNELSNNRYILRDGRLHPLPMSPPAFLKTKLFSWGAKLRLLKEPFVGRALKEESIAEFVERRLGREFLDYAINPFVAGVYAGNPEQLSVRHAFPKLFALEEKYGGLIKGMIGSRNERRQRKEVAKDKAKLFSFKNGMETLPKALSKYLGDSVQLGCTVEHIIPMKVGKHPIYHISYKQDETKTTIEAKAVVLSSPATATANIIRPIDPEFAETLNAIYYPPVTVAFTGFRKEQIKRDLDGFGFLIPAKEQRKILGSLWSSTLFSNRAPNGHVALTTFLGGARQPEESTKYKAQSTKYILDELNSIIGLDGDPVFTKLFHWEKAIPQYNLGYGKVLNAIERFEANFRGAFICSNYRGGISVGDCVMSAEKITRNINELIENYR